MNDILLINKDDILHYTSISGNIDELKLYPCILNSQILYIEPILGSDLYNKILQLVDSNDITGSTYTNYQSLLNFIIPSLVFHTLELFIPMNSFEIGDAGTFRWTSTNSNVSSMDEIDKLSQKYKVISSKYDLKLSEYLCKYSYNYPEYITNEGIVKKTENTQRIGGFYTGINNSKRTTRI